MPTMKTVPKYVQKAYKILIINNQKTNLFLIYRSRQNQQLVGNLKKSNKHLFGMKRKSSDVCSILTISDEEDRIIEVKSIASRDNVNFIENREIGSSDR